MAEYIYFYKGKITTFISNIIYLVRIYKNNYQRNNIPQTQTKCSSIPMVIIIEIRSSSMTSISSVGSQKGTIAVQSIYGDSALLALNRQYFHFDVILNIYLYV